jgi:hypothetical protein
MQQAPGFVDGDGKVVKLGKSIYGLKQAPRIWYLTLCEALRDLGLKPISAVLESCPATLEQWSRLHVSCVGSVP